uniref:(California timema) hypothetical protein n=1 Tax=Timema californicum TaxID=61474 RepID=A0A7R9PAB5_TIMCA|nr:unnamed protein product [Timema californicum]
MRRSRFESQSELVYKQTLVLDQSLFSERLIATSLLDVDTSSPVMNRVLCSGSRDLYVLNATNRNHTNHILQTLSRARWFVLLVWVEPSSDNCSSVDLFADTSVPMLSVLLIAEEGDEEITVTEVYRVAKNLPVKRRHFATWSGRSGLKVESRNIWRTRSDLEGLDFKVGVSLSKDDMFQNPQQSGSIADMESFVFGQLAGSVLLSLQSQMKFNLQLIAIPQKNFKDRKLRKTNFMRDLLDGKLDTSSEAMLFTDDRIQVMDYTHPVETLGQVCYSGFHDRSSPDRDSNFDLLVLSSRAQHDKRISQLRHRGSFGIVIKHAQMRMIKWNEFILPFDRPLWLAIFVCLFVIGTHMTVLSYLNERTLGADRRNLSLQDSFFHSLGALICAQGQVVVPGNSMVRCLILTSHLTGAVLLAAYSAFLISFISAQKYNLPFTSLKGLYEDGSFSLGVLDQSGLYEIFAHDNNTLTKKLFNKYLDKENHEQPKTHIEAFGRVCTERYAYLSPLKMTKMKHPGCRLLFIPHTMTFYKAGFVFRKDSPYYKVINYQLTKIFNFGILDRHQKMFQRRRNWTLERKLTNVDLFNVLPVICVLACGILLSFIQRSWVQSPALPEFICEAAGLNRGQTQPHEDLDEEVAAPV